MDRATVVFDLIGLCLVSALMAWTISLALTPAPEPEPPTVVVDTLYSLEPNCRRAGRYDLGNSQRDSVAIMLVCQEGQP